MADPRDHHSRFSGGWRWRLTRKGVEIEAKGHPRTRGKPATMTLFAHRFQAPLAYESRRHGMPVELILATIGAEGGPRLHAVRHEPHYPAHVVRVPNNQEWVAWAEASNAAAVRFLNLHWREIPVGCFEEADETPVRVGRRIYPAGSRVSIGIMHTLISTASDALGKRVTRAELLRPEVSIAAGASYINHQKRVTGWDPPVVGAAYNAGSVRENQSPRNPWRMVQYPIGTGQHCNRFVAFYNDAVAVVSAMPGVFQVTHRSYWF